MSGHTPGPWTIDPAEHDSGWMWQMVCGDGKRTIANVAVNDDEGRSNARLIAAAPDLLAACKVAINDRMFKEWPEVATILREAITKAEGE